MGAGSSIEDYYCNLAREDYYTKGGEPAGLWFGRGAFALGLDGMVDVLQLRQTMQGNHPNGNSLVQGAGERHRAGWDCTFSAPKSVSVAWAVATLETRQAIAAAQAKAVQSALKFIEQQACHARRGKAGMTEEHVSGIVAACFEHGTSREGDPQLHTHCLVHNLAMRQDGSWGGIESLRLFQWKMAAGAIYRTELAAQMKSLGFDVKRDRDGFRVAAIPQSAEKLFSTRRSQIEKVLEEKNLTSAAASQVAALESRSKKTEVHRSQLFPQWAEQAKEIGLGAQSIEAMRIRTRSQDAMPSHGELLSTLTGQASTFGLNEIYQKAGVAAQGNLDSQGVRGYVAAMLKDEQLVRLGNDEHGAQRFTTREMLEIESGVARDAQTRSPENRHHLARNIVDKIVRARPTISEEQKTALHYITTESGGIACVQGIAGSGKSYLMDACREAFERSGFTLRGCALSGKAAQGLEEGSGIKSQTLHSLLGELTHGRIQLSRKDVVVLDEAGMVGSRQFAQLLGYVNASGSKLVAIGDARQLQPIDAGGAFRLLTKTIHHVELNDIRRQREVADRQMVRDLADGNAAAAMASLDTRGLVQDATDIESVMRKLVTDWQKDATPLAQKIILAGTRAESKSLNNLVRDALYISGKLHGVSTDIETASGIRQFAEGDRVLFTRNSLKLGVKNGTLATLVRISTNRQGECEMTAKTDDGHSVRFSPTTENGYNHLDHGYAMSVHKAQGATVTNAYLLASDSMGDREWAYVGASRARESTCLYCTTQMKERLAQTFGRSRQKNTSLDYPHQPIANKTPSLPQLDLGPSL